MNRLGKFGTGLEPFRGLLLQRALQDFPHLLLHRAPIPRRAHFQVTLRAFVQLSDSNARHDCNDIIAINDYTSGPAVGLMISLAPRIAWIVRFAQNGRKQEVAVKPRPAFPMSRKGGETWGRCNFVILRHLHSP